MQRALLRLAPVLHLARVTTAFAAMANVWFVILWTRWSGAELAAAPGPLRAMPLWVLLIGGAVNALGLSAFAASLNDLLDYRRDRVIHPERPLPAGRLSLNAALALVVGTFMAAVVGACVLGISAVLLTVVVSAAILVFNGAGKFVPGVGLVLLGLIYAGHMVVPNLSLRFVWPVWLVMTHALAVGAASYVVGGKVPTVSRRAAGLVIAGWVFWSGVMIYAGWVRGGGRGGLWPEWVRPGAAVGPVLLAVLFVMLCVRKVRLYGRGPRSAEKIARYGALWLALYACAWLIGQGYAGAGWLMAGVTAAGFAGMTVLREMYSLAEQPLGYRR